jgi:hypothetical protein
LVLEDTINNLRWMILRLSPFTIHMAIKRAYRVRDDVRRPLSYKLSFSDLNGHLSKPHKLLYMTDRLFQLQLFYAPQS